MRFFRRMLLMMLCLLMLCSSAAAQTHGIRFSLSTSVDPSGWPEAIQPLAEGLSQLLDAIALEGDLTLNGDSFDLHTQLSLGHSSDAAVTTLHVFGLPSHWGVRSSLLGETELMVNCASLLPFGQKARSYLGLPLDGAALLVPYTHVHGLAPMLTLLSPLFPTEDISYTLSHDDVNALVMDLALLCDEDPALSQYLEATGLYAPLQSICGEITAAPESLLPILTITRSGDTLTWTAGALDVLRLETTPESIQLSFQLPGISCAEAACSVEGDLFTARVRFLADGFSVEARIQLPVLMQEAPADLLIQLDITCPEMPDDGLHLYVTGCLSGERIALSMIHPGTSAPMLTIEGNITPFVPDDLPSYTPADLTGVNVLSVTSDSLSALLRDVRQPLLTGLLDLLVAAPAPAIQTLMDYAENSGLIDMITAMLSGGYGY